MNIGYVCTTHNSSALTREAVRSLVQNTGHSCSVVMVDNDSNQENANVLKRVTQDFPNVELISNDENVGYFKGLNIGIRHLRTTRPDIDVIVIGNDDLVFPPDFIDSIGANTAILGKYPVVSPDIVTLDGVHQNPHVIRNIGKFREFIYDLYYANYYLAAAISRVANLTRSFTDRPDETFHAVAQEIYQGYGACYILGPVFFRHFDELWSPALMTHEEFFLSKQLNDVGMSVYYEPSIRVSHRCRGTMGTFASRKVWELGRGGHRIYRQHVRIFG